ncbi:hypothetical protein [Claveliimonas sp.]|uniref:hypothetical protein n=1 Tax=Claveliimonas sp. TaxID=3076672 RepID=UPI00307C83CC
MNIDNKKITFLFLYEHLKLGGIEKTIIDQIRVYSCKGIRIVWLRYGRPEDIYEPWKQVINECNLEIIDVNIKKKKWLDKKKLIFSPNEIVYAIAYEPFDFVRLEELANEYLNEIKLFYQVPHFEGRVNYLEEYYSSYSKRKKIKSQLAIIYRRWYENGNIIFFSYKHIEEMSKRYNINCLNRKDLVFQTPIEPEPFDEQLAYERAKREEFRIITCGRFEFPHKGYMFGLIDSYCKLKKNYPQIKLDIIGYGVCERQIRSYVDKLSPEYSKDIVFRGAVSPEKIKHYFNKSHMNVSVAYSLLDGAKTGLVSLPARHYTYDCEVYGYLSDEIGNYLDNREGEAVDKYIEDLINMEPDEYILLCKKSYQYALNNLEYDPNWLFKKNNLYNNYYSRGEVRYFKRIEKHHVLKAWLYKNLYNISRELGVYKWLKNVKNKLSKENK